MVWASDFMIWVRGDRRELEEVQGSQGQGGRELVCESHPCPTRKPCDLSPHYPRFFWLLLFAPS